MLGSEDMFDRAFEVSEYEARVPFVAGGLEVTAVPVDHYDIDAYGFRIKGDRIARLLRRQRPLGGAGRARRATPTCS